MSCALADPSDWETLLLSEFGPPSEAGAVEVRATFRGVVTHSRILSLADARGRSSRRPSTRQFTIGSAARVDAPVAADFVPWESHPLVLAAGNGYLVNVTPQMKGRVRIGGQVQSLDNFTRANGNTFVLPPSAAAQLDCGATSFMIARTSPPRRLPAPPLTVNWPQQRYTVASAAALALMLLVISFIPEDSRALSLDLLGSERHFVSSLIKPPAEERESLPAWLRAGEVRRPAAASAGRAHNQPVGAMGDKASPQWVARFSIRAREDERDPRLAKSSAIEAIREAGVLGVLKAASGAKMAAAAIFAGESALGGNAEEVIGHLHGATVATAYGPGGLGDAGTGSAAGDRGGPILGVGELRTIGDRNGIRGGDRYAPGVGALPRRVAGPPRWIPDHATVRGSLDKEIVRRVIRLHLNEIKYCYEQELTRHPALAGRMVVQFTITPAGQVIASALQSSTIGNTRVENCTVQAVRRWQFPQPQGGGLVIVSYPFVLAPAGG